jgi:DNA polymerase III delta subunit
MKVIILHGDDEKKLYHRLSKFIETAKARSWEISYLDDRSQSIQEQLSSPSLFGAERFFIIRDVTRLGKKELEWINKNLGSLSGTLIIYHEGYVSQTIIKAFSNDTKVEEFKLPVILWNFLDGIYPGNSERSIKSFHQIIEKQAPEFIFTLIAKLFRDLYWVKTDEKSLPYPSWRIGKLKAQASKFTIGNLPSDGKLRLQLIINKLSDIDIKVKTSKSDLVSELDLLIIKQLE